MAELLERDRRREAEYRELEARYQLLQAQYRQLEQKCRHLETRLGVNASNLRDLLLALGRVVPIRGYDESLLSISPHDVLARLQRGDPSWEGMVPAAAAATIKAGALFGWRPAQAPAVVA